MREFRTLLKLTTPISERSTSQKEAVTFNSKAMNAIFNVFSMKEFKRISNVEDTHNAWNILQTVHEGIRQLGLINCSSYILDLKALECLMMNVWMNSMLSLMILLILLIIWVKFMINMIVRKILRSLTENFRPKVTVITKSKDVDSIPVDELVGPLQFYELDLPKTEKSK